MSDRFPKLKVGSFNLAVTFCLIVVTGTAIAGDTPINEDVFLGLTPDAQTGYELITSKPMGRAIMKVEDVARLWLVWEEEEKAKAENAERDELMRMTFVRYGWVKRPGDTVPNLPLGYTEDGKGNLVTNCFSCHGGKVAGKTMPGSGNTHVDLATFRLDLSRLRALDEGKDPSKVKPDSRFVTNYHKGFTNAVIFEVVNWVRANPDVMLQVAANPDLLMHHDMNPPAWWTTKRKERLYSDAFAPKTPRQNMPFARGRGQENWEERWHALEPDFVHILQYIEELEVPKYPYEIDTGLAAIGEKLFNKTCADCHGTYGPNGEYPDIVIPHDQVGTDEVRLHAVPEADRVWNNKTWLQYDGKYPVWLKSEGFRAPPLDGIWASAPYFHNGAAPTLTAVMNSKERPKVWKRTEDGYDQVNVGLEVEVFDKVPENLSPRIRRMHYDTSHKGNSAAGHEFPDVLDAEEKKAVIEYLKTL